MKERRAFNSLPEYLKTNHNNKEMYISDDVMFEPENADFLIGYIGDTSEIVPIDLQRIPEIKEKSDIKQKYQLSLGVAHVDGNSGVYLNGCFYEDLVNHIDNNGGLVDDHNRLFNTNFYAWSPPIDYDKHINFSRYFWTGIGDADVNGEYITKEPAGSLITLYKFNGTNFVKVNVSIHNGLPSSGKTGDVIEDASTAERKLYEFDGSSWKLVTFASVENIPEDTTSYVVNQYLYVCRTGINFNRPILWKYSEDAGRWISIQPIISKETPAYPSDGMVWENSQESTHRTFQVYENGVWQTIDFIPASDISGIVSHNTYMYDIRSLDDVADGWSKNNWWRHADDLSLIDKELITFNKQAIRPILEFWHGIESVVGDVKNSRNDAPLFNLYAYDTNSNDILELNSTNFPGLSFSGSTIFEYKRGTGADDAVLDFPLSFNNSGEFEFDLTLESDPITINGEDLKGYRFFKDSMTGLVHSIWAKSDVKLIQEQDDNGLFELPKNLTTNSDHAILKTFSRSDIIFHMGSVMENQTSFVGHPFGPNTWRFSNKNPTIGSTIIDSEQSLLRTMSLLQQTNLDIPDAIRMMAKEYNKVLFKFTNKLNQMFDNNILADVTGTLFVTTSEAVDAILTELFVGRTEDFPFYYSDMGKFVETEVTSEIATVLDETPKPIFIPPSPAKIGASKAYKPCKFKDKDGNVKLQNHDGSTTNSFGDNRDDVWLELQTRFFNSVPSIFKTETTTESTRFNKSKFFVDDYYGNYEPLSALRPVDKVVDDYKNIVTPIVNERVFSKAEGVYATYNGTFWLTENSFVDDIFMNEEDGLYYIFNGVGTFPITTWNKSFKFDYSINEFRRIIRREFERWVVSRDEDMSLNTDFDRDNPFTWNYSSSGIEGHYLGIYRRLYRTTRPHSHPWEILGYSIEPDWWQNHYIPTSIDEFGFPRYSKEHDMWNDIIAGIVNPLTGTTDVSKSMIAPIPVDKDGELLNPIEAGIVDISSLDMLRIDDGWMFGDGSPLEHEFMNSPYWPFTIALVGYLMKPAVWVDTLWSDLHIPIGLSGTNKLWRAPHIIHSEDLVRPSLTDRTVHLENINGTIVQKLGINAWLAEKINIIGASVNNDFAEVLRNSVVTLGWKASGFINRNRTTIRTLSGNDIPFEDIHVVLHQSVPIEEKFCSGVVIIPEDTGYRVFGFDQFNPFFRIELPIQPIFGGQTELRETFIAEDDQHDFEVKQFTLPYNVNNSDTAKFSVMVNGYRIKPQHIIIRGKSSFSIEGIVNISKGDEVVVSVMTTQSNNKTRVKTFTIDGVQFPYITEGSGTYANIEYGRYFDSAVDVINFMLGYGRYLETQGWIFDYKNEATGSTEDWLFGAKSFATWIINRTKRWDEDTNPIDTTQFTFSPIRREGKLASTFGHIQNVENIRHGAYGIINEGAMPIDPKSTTSSRLDDVYTLTNNNALDMFGLRLYISEIQHVVFFSPTTKFNDVIYDPYTALYLKTLIVNSYRSKDWNGRMEADGFIINGTNLLPNFEKQAYDIINFYDRINPPDDTVLRDQALNLYGWYPSDAYMDPINASERGRVEYYRGMIQTKGTRKPFYAYARGTALGTENTNIFEDWAWKTAEYGDTRKERVQFKVFKNDFTEEVQVISFGNGNNENQNIITINDFDRNNPNDNRWIIPPTITDKNTFNLTFPVDGNGNVDLDNYRYHAQLYNVTNGYTILRHVHYDPEQGKFEPEAYRQIDYETTYDPARYNNGERAEYSNDLIWGEEQVGQLWWSIFTREFVDYKSLLPDYDLAATEWGKLKYFRANITRVDDVAIVETLDPYTRQPVPHGLSPINVVSIIDAKETDYNVDNVAITVISPTKFEFEITTAPETPATGDIKVIVGFIHVYEWVKSPVPPQEWETYVAGLTGPDTPSGEVFDSNSDNPSYVRIDTLDNNGNTVSNYYFWVRNNKATNPRKDYTTFDITQRLANPTLLGIPWFAPIDKNHMAIYTDGEKVLNDYAIDLLIDGRKHNTHVEWVLLSENDIFKEVPEVITEKVKDSLIGEDQFGHPVPSPLLSDLEKYGNSNFPAQTIFRHLPNARKTWLEVINNKLKSFNIRDNLSLIAYFDLADEYSASNPNGFWKRVEYRDTGFSDTVVFDTVPKENDKITKANNRMYNVGDLVKVKVSNSVDPWDTDATVYTVYEYRNNNFTAVGYEKHAIELNENIFNNVARFREIYDVLYNNLSKLNVNHVTFALLREMLRQQPLCDWFFKTSYISIHLNARVSSASYLRQCECESTIENILDTKPYRTKIRSQTFTYNILDEDFNLELVEIPDNKITVMFDRLSCNLIDDYGWDTTAWDTSKWDYPVWRLSNLGTDDYIERGRITGDGVSRKFTFPAKYDPTLYNVRFRFYQDGSEINPRNIGLNYTVSKTHTSVSIELTTSIPFTMELVYEQSQGFYEGETPKLPSTLDNTLLQPATITYEHHAARTLTTNYNPCSEMSGCDLNGCNSDDGGNPEERIKTEVQDSINICVKNDWTPIYSAWDTTGWDTTAWDSGVPDVGRRIMVVSVGGTDTISPGIEVFPTSEDIVVTSNPYVIGASPLYNIVKIEHSTDGTTYNELIEGSNYKIGDIPNIIEFMVPAAKQFIADGVETSYEFPEATNGIKEVRVNGALLQHGQHYEVVGTHIYFFQPPPTILTNNATAIGKSYVVTGSSNTFHTGFSVPEINPKNILAFVNSKLQTALTDYNDDGFGLIRFDESLDISDEVVLFTFGNDFGDTSDIFNIQEFQFVSGTDFAVTEGYLTTTNSFVFLDDKYLILNHDYIILDSEHIRYLGPIDTSKKIKIINTHDQKLVDGEHMVVISNGSQTIPLNGIVDADPTKMLVFIDDQLMNGYSTTTSPDYYISKGNPDVLVWVTPPSNGAKITIRMFRSVQVSTTTIVNIFPTKNSSVYILPNAYVDNGDSIRITYNGWYIGPLGGYTISSAPDDWDIVDGVLTLNNTPNPNEFITVNYTTERKGERKRSLMVRTSNLVDDIMEDHTLYDEPKGLEINRLVGTRIANTTDNVYYKWDGAQWINDGAINLNDEFFVKRKQEIWKFNGSNYDRLYSIGNGYANPPVLDYPPFGFGVTWGTYVYGQLPTASTDYPAAYQIMQHAGDW